MKNHPKELNVDFIGGQNKTLTKEEQLAITAFISKLKEKRTLLNKRKQLKTKKQLA